MPAIARMARSLLQEERSFRPHPRWAVREQGLGAPSIQ